MVTHSTINVSKKDKIYGLAENCGISSVLAMETPQSLH